MNLPKETKEILEALAPELAKSKDERIRKELIEFIKWSVDRHFMREDFHQAKRPSEWIAYLEKQKELPFVKDVVLGLPGLYFYDGERMHFRGSLAMEEKHEEQKHPNGCFTCDEYKKGYEEGRRNGFTAGYNKAMKEVEQKEQKPVVTLGETYHVDTLGTQQVIAGKMPTDKPAEWSEEDKHNLNSAINLVHATTDGAWGSCIGDRIENWLKNLPERFNPQPKPEWS